MVRWNTQFSKVPLLQFSSEKEFSVYLSCKLGRVDEEKIMVSQLHLRLKGINNQVVVFVSLLAKFVKKEALFRQFLLSYSPSLYFPLTIYRLE